MSTLPATSPAWLRHLNGDLPDPTDKDIEADKQATEDALTYLHTHGKWDAESAHGIDDLNTYYSQNFPPIDTKRSGNAGGNPFAAWLARIDWNRVFIVVARLLVSIGMLFAAYQYFQYTRFFGAGALAFIGQFLIGAFFVAVVFLTRDGLPIMTAALGMYLLVNSF